jgi:hypothetical protein
MKREEAALAFVRQRFDDVPAYGTYTRLGVDVLSSGRDVVRAAHRKLAPKGRSRAQREARHAFLYAMLAHHWNASRLFRYVALGGEG